MTNHDTYRPSGVFIPVELNQEPEAQQEAINDILAKLGDVGLTGIAVTGEQSFRQDLLPYDFERNPSLGIESFVEFADFGESINASHNLVARVWSRLCDQSEEAANLQLVRTKIAELSVEKEREATLDDIGDICEQEGLWSWMAAPSIKELLDGPIETPFVFTDHTCAAPLLRRHKFIPPTSHQRLRRQSYMLVDRMYQIVAGTEPGKGLRSPKYNDLLVSFLNNRVRVAQKQELT